MCISCLSNGQGISWANFDHNLNSYNESLNVSPYTTTNTIPSGYNQNQILQYASMAQGYSLSDLWTDIKTEAKSVITGAYDWVSNNVSGLPLNYFAVAASYASNLPATPILNTKYYLPTNIDSDVLALFSGSQWGQNTVTYSLPDSRDDYEFYNVSASGYKPLSFEAEQGVRYALEGYSPYSGASKMTLGSVESLTNLDLVYAGRNDADVKVAGFAPGSTINRSHGYYPGIPLFGGDTWLTRGDSAPGSASYQLILHELGHSLGLKHPHDSGMAQPKMSAAHDSVEYTVMSYNEFYSTQNPQTYMQYDVAALQEMYGADFTTNAGNTTYTWNPNTGETYVNGVSQGVPLSNRIFLTIWDGGGNDTYDVSNYNEDASIDLNAGGVSLLSRNQLAQKSGGYARGNVYNAFQYHGSTQSLIENVISGAGNDTIQGNQVANSLWGNAGNDTLSGGAGNDTAWGGTGIDKLYGDEGNDFLVGEVGNDSLWGGSGNDELWGGVDNDQLLGDSGNDFLAGEAGNDYLAGSSGDDTLWGGAGNDTAWAGADNDIVYGEDGNDYIGGEAGNDVLWGGNGTDKLYGGIGNDQLCGDAGDDFLAGETGNDYLLGADGNDTLYGGTGEDTLWGSSGNDELYAEDGNDFVAGDSGNDILQGNAGNDTIFGGTDQDKIWGGLDDDRLYGEDGDDWIAGEWGNDYIEGNNGNDVLGGQDGNDTIVGGAGNDTLYGGSGFDTLTGGADRDVFAFEAPANGANVSTVTDFTVGMDLIQLSRGHFFGSNGTFSLAVGDRANGWNAQVIYNSNMGELSYDADGLGSAATQIKFAQLAKGLALTSASFYLA